MLVLVLAAGPVLGVGCWYWVLIVGLALVCQVRTSSIAPVSFACKNLSNVLLTPSQTCWCCAGSTVPLQPPGQMQLLGSGGCFSGHHSSFEHCPL